MELIPQPLRVRFFLDDRLQCTIKDSVGHRYMIAVASKYPTRHEEFSGIEQVLHCQDLPEERGSDWHGYGRAQEWI